MRRGSNSFDFPLIVENITKQYGDFTAVQNLSFQVEKGEIYGFLGQNGAGKTSTLRMIMDIVPQTAGTLTVLGSPSPRKVRKRIGYLPEERGLYRKMRAYEAITHFAQLKGVSARKAKQRAHALLEEFGLGAFAKSKIEALSKGMAQKVQLLSTVAHEPELLILDEPFSGLDPVNQQVLEDMILELRNQGRTIIFSTHVMEHAERLCDRFLMLRKGQKVFEGTLAEAQSTDEPVLILETPDDPLPLLNMPEITDIIAQDKGQYALVVAPMANKQEILRACLQQNIRVEFFGEATPSLHDIFFRLAGADTQTGESR
ncbi:MAG: ATP-binding cassette domain-containing protein [Pseudomonadota bacterium]